MKYAIKVYRSSEHYLGEATMILHDFRKPCKPALFDTLQEAEVRVKFLEEFFADREDVTFKTIEYTKELF